MRPGTRLWVAALWLLLAVNTPLIVTGLLVKNTAIEATATGLALVGVAGAVIQRRAVRRETSR